MIEDRVAAIEQAIAGLRRDREMEQIAGALRTRADELAAVATIERLLQLAIDLRQRGISVTLDLAAVEALAANASRLLGAFEHDRSSIAEADRVRTATFWKPLRELPEELRSTIQAAWRAYVQGRVVVDREIVQVMGAIPSFGLAVGELNRLMNQLSGVARQLPQEESDFTGLDELVASIDQRWQAFLGGGDFPDEVRSFLLAASSSNGAPPKLFTIDVQKWLIEHQLYKHVSMHFG